MGAYSRDGGKVCKKIAGKLVVLKPGSDEYAKALRALNAKPAPAEKPAAPAPEPTPAAPAALSAPAENEPAPEKPADAPAKGKGGAVVAIVLLVLLVCGALIGAWKARRPAPAPESTP